MNPSPRVRDVSERQRSETTATDQCSDSGVGRRAMLVSGATLLATLAGCTADDDDPATVTDPTEADGDEQESHASELESNLVDAGIDVVSLEFDAEAAVVTLTYATQRQTDEELADEIGTISGEFFVQLDEGIPADRLESTITTGEGEDPIAHWHAESAWYEEFQNDEITPNELSIRVLETVELTDE